MRAAQQKGEEEGRVRQRRTRQLLHACIESLETRRMLTYVWPTGPEQLVNSFTTGNQFSSAIARDADGDYLIVWSGSTNEVHAQRYSASGARVGSEFQVHDPSPRQRGLASAAMNAAGEFVVTWTEVGPDRYGVVGRRFDAAGNAISSEFLVNNVTATSNVAIDAHGNFVVVWTDSPGPTLDVLAQRYNSAAEPIGEPFAVSSNLSGSESDPDVAMNAWGDFVVTWRGNGTGDVNGILARVFSNAGVPLASDMRVNTYTTHEQARAQVAADASGDFIIAWESQNQDGDAYGIYARRFDAAGTPLGTEFHVNTYTTGDQRRPSVAVDADGDVVIAWTVGTSDATDIAARRYSSDGTPRGDEFAVNTYTTGPQSLPFVAADADGDFVVAWSGYRAGATGWDVYHQRYSSIGVPLGNELLVNNSTAESQFPAIATDSGGNFTIAWEVGTTSGTDVLARRYDSSGNAIGSEFRVHTHTTAGQTEPAVAMDAAGNFTIVWMSQAQFGESFDIYARRFDSSGLALGSEFLVNSYTTDYQGNPSIAMAADGRFVVAWRSFGQDGSGLGIFGRRYDASGTPLGTEFLINSHTTGSQAWSSVAMNAAGESVVSWSSQQDGNSYGVYAQRYDAAGAAVGGEFRVNTYTTGEQTVPEVAMGDFVVAWQSASQDGNLGGIFGRRYTSDGIPLGTEFQVNTYSTGNQSFPAATMDSQGNFVIAWHGPGDQGVSYSFARYYGSGGLPVSGEFRLNSRNAGSEQYPCLAFGSDGAFVASWQSFIADWEVQAQIFIISDLSPPAPIVAGSRFVWEQDEQRIDLIFDQNIGSTFSVADLMLTDTTTGMPVDPSSYVLAFDASTLTATIRSTAIPLHVFANGHYKLDVFAAGIATSSGLSLASDHHLEFFFLSADANHDAKVDLKDLMPIAANYMQPSGLDYRKGDFNFDGIVDHKDLGILAVNWQVSLAPPLPSPPVATAAAGRSAVRTPTRVAESILQPAAPTPLRTATRMSR